MTTKATRTNFTATSDTQLVAANEGRVGLCIYNEGPGALHVAYGPTAASTTSYSVKIEAGEFWEDPFRFKGSIRAIMAAAGTARVTELT